MKKTIRRADGSVEELQGSPSEIRDYEGRSSSPPVSVPTPFWVDPPAYPPTYQFVPNDHPCAVEEAFKRDPNQVLGLVCTCPRCSPRCVVTYATSTLAGPA